MATNNQIIASIPAIAVANADGAIKSLQLTSNVSANIVLTDSLLYANGQPWNFSAGSVALYQLTDVTVPNETVYTPTLVAPISGGDTWNVASFVEPVTGTYQLTLTCDNVVGELAIYVGSILYPDATATAFIHWTVIDVNWNPGSPNKYIRLQPTGAAVGWNAGDLFAAYTYAIQPNIQDNSALIWSNALSKWTSGTAIAGNYGNANVANYLPTYTGNFSANNANFSGQVFIGGNTVIAANLRVVGNITALNFNTLNTGNLQIILAANATQPSDANNAGLVINGANASILYNYLSNTLNITPGIRVSSNSTFGNTQVGNIFSNYYYPNGQPFTGGSGISGINLVEVDTVYPQIYTVAGGRIGLSNAIDTNGDPWTYVYYGWDSTSYTIASITAGDHSFVIPGVDVSSWFSGDQLAFNNTATGPYNTIFSITFDGTDSTVTVANPFPADLTSPTVYHTNLYNQVSTPTPIGSTLIVGTPESPQFTVIGQSNYSNVSYGTYGGTSFSVDQLQGPYAEGIPVYTTRTAKHSNAFVNILLGGNLIGNVSNNANFTGNTLYLDSYGSGGNYSNSNVANFLLTNTGNINANYYLGNGRFLTGIITGSNVSFANTNSITYTSNSNVNSFNVVDSYIANIADTEIASKIGNTNPFNSGTKLSTSGTTLIVTGTTVTVTSSNNELALYNQLTGSSATSSPAGPAAPLAQYAYLATGNGNLGSYSALAAYNSVQLVGVAGFQLQFNFTSTPGQFTGSTPSNTTYAGNTTMGATPVFTFQSGPNAAIINDINTYSVSSLNTLRGNVSILPGNGIGILTSGSNITVTATGGNGNGISSSNFTTFVDDQYVITAFEGGSGDPYAVYVEQGYQLGAPGYADLTGGLIGSVAYITTPITTIPSYGYGLQFPVSTYYSDIEIDVWFPGFTIDVTLAGGTPTFTIDGVLFSKTGLSNASDPDFANNLFPPFAAAQPGSDDIQMVIIQRPTISQSSLGGNQYRVTVGASQHRGVINGYNGLGTTQQYSAYLRFISTTFGGSPTVSSVTNLTQVGSSGGIRALVALPGVGGATPSLQQVLTIGNTSNIGIVLTNNANITTSGNISSNYFLGNGSQLTGIITSVSNVVNGNSNIQVYANSNVTVSVSNVANVVTVTSNSFNLTTNANINLSGNVNGNANTTYYLGNGRFLTGISGGSSLVNGNSNVIVTANSNVTVSVSNVANVVTVTTSSVDLTTNANINLSGNVNGNANTTYYLGNGRFLTGISGGSSLVNGNSNVIVAANGNVSISVGGVTNVAVFTSNNVLLANTVVSNVLALGNANTAPVYGRGNIWYDNNVDALTYYNGVANNTVHIGQELQYAVWNNTASTIGQGVPVYVQNGATGNVPNVALAQANALPYATVFGVANQPIPANTLGYVVTTGLIANASMGSYTVGDNLYLSPYSAGQVTNSPPPTGLTVRVGIVTYNNSPNGRFDVALTPALGNTNIGNLLVLGNATVQGNLIQSGNAYFSSNVVTTGNTIANGNIYFNSNSFIASNALFTANAIHNANSYFNSNVVTTGNLLANGNIYFNSNSFITSNVLVTANIIANANSYFNSNVVTTGNTIANGNIYFNSNSFITSNVLVTANIIANANSYFNSNVLTTGNLLANGNIYFNSNSFITSNVLVTANIIANANSYFNSNVYITGNANAGNFIGTLANGNSNIAIAGNGNIDLNMTTTSNINLAGNVIFSNVGNIWIPNPVVGSALIANTSGNLAWAPIVHYFPGVYVATTTALTATYNNGTSGVGATLTNTGTLAALNIDSQAVSAGQRVLVKDQATQAQNGIYTVTTAGSGAVAWVLTRATDYDQPQEMLGNDLFTVQAGAVNSAAVFVQTNRIITVGTTAVIFDSSGVLTLQNVLAAGNVSTIGMLISNVANANPNNTGGALQVTGGISVGNAGSNTATSIFGGNVTFVSNVITNTNIFATGNINANGIVYHGNSGDGGANSFQIYSRGTTTANGLAGYNILYTPAQEIRTLSSNGTPIFTFGSTSDLTGLITAGTVALQVRPTAAGNVRILPVVGSGVTNANLMLESVGANGAVSILGNTRMPGRGTFAAMAAFTDQPLSIGSSDAGNSTSPVVLGIQSANSTFSGLRLIKGSNNEAWYIGTDSSSTTGNLVVNGTGGTYFNCLYDGTNRYVTSPATNRMANYRKTSFTQSNGVDTIISWDNTDSSIPGTTMSSGVFTNTGPARKFTFTFQNGLSGLTTTAEVDIWFSLNGAVSSTNRYGRVTAGTIGMTATIQLATLAIYLNTNDTIRCYSWQNSSGTVTNGGSGFGSAANYTTQLTIVEG